MRLIAALALGLFMAASCLTAPARADTLDTLDAQARADVAAVEAYLNGIKTLQAHFIQTSGDGKRVGGDFLLKRPGRMRFTYNPPLTDFIVADGTFVHYYDGAMKQGSRTLISRSLADFFLRDRLTLSGDLSVTKVWRDSGYLMLMLTEAAHDSEGSLTLALAEKPQLELKKWRIVDPQGGTTEVELVDAQYGVKIDRDQFFYYDPEHGKPNLNR